MTIGRRARRREGEPARGLGQNGSHGSRGAGSPGFTYHIYGRSVVCDRPLPELQVAEGPAFREAISVRLTASELGTDTNARWFLESADPGGNVWLRCARVGSEYLLRYCRVADFMINRSEIRCVRVVRETSEVTLRHVLLDGVLPLFMNLVGQDGLHATAVATEQGVVAFTGAAGAGKSTLAAAFVREGHELFCDDCLLLERRDEVFGIPGYWGLRLWSDSQTALRLDDERSAQTNFKTRSLTSRARDLLCRKPMRVTRIYQVKREPADSAPRIAPLTGREAVAQLIRASYRLDVDDTQMLARQFRLLSQLADQSPVKALIVPNDFKALPIVRNLILEDLATEQ